MTVAASAITPSEFAAAMAILEPFEPMPRLAAGVSGGADSTALAVLAQRWVEDRGGSLLALVVDHGLRETSGQEASATAERLRSLGIPAQLIAVDGLARGPALAERARAARFSVLEAACAEAGILHLLLGHHAGDQAETLLIRSIAGSGWTGMAGMIPLVERARLRLLRPLLTVAPDRLRAMLAEGPIPWVEDPSNLDTGALRPRLRLARRDRDGAGSATTALVAAASASARRRADHDRGIGGDLVEHAVFRPEGFAILSGRPLSVGALAAVVQTISGRQFPPASRSVRSLAAVPKAATLGGVRLLPAGRLGDGLLVVREISAMSPQVSVRRGAIWDGRFRVGPSARVSPEATLGALGEDAARFRRLSVLPSAVLQTLPAIRSGSALLAIPHLVYPDKKTCACFPLLFCPARQASAAPFSFGDA